MSTTQDQTEFYNPLTDHINNIAVLAQVYNQLYSERINAAGFTSTYSVSANNYPIGSLTTSSANSNTQIDLIDWTESGLKEKVRIQILNLISEMLEEDTNNEEESNEQEGDCATVDSSMQFSTDEAFMMMELDHHLIMFNLSKELLFGYSQNTKKIECEDDQEKFSKEDLSDDTWGVVEINKTNND